MNRYSGLGEAVVLVTGAGGGLGAAVAARFADQGARVLITDVDRPGLERQVAGLGLGPDRLLAEVADLGDAGAYDRLVRRCVEGFGRLDVLVNNAAILGRAPLADVTPESFDRVLAVNLRAPFFLSRAALSDMRPRRRGSIVNVASMAARSGGTSDIFAYAASKAGLLSVTRSLARVAAPDNVRVNAILPSNIEGPMLRDGFPHEVLDRVLGQIPIGRTARADEVAELVLWLASDAASYVTGAAWDINGGWQMT